MSKPILEVTLESGDGTTALAHAIVDSGSFNTVVRDTALPAACPVFPETRLRELAAAAIGSRLRVTGATILKIHIQGKIVRDDVLITPDLRQDILIGAGTMQKWDISIRNENGQTSVSVGRDMRDPDLNEVD